MSNTAPADFFSGTNNLDASSRLPYFPANFNGRVRIDVCKGISGRKGRAYVVEVTVLTSNLANLTTTDPTYVPVGSKRSWYQGIPPVDSNTAYQSCIGFLYAAMGLSQSNDQAKIDAEIKPKQDAYLNHSISAAQPLAGAEVMLQTFNKKMKDGKSDFTVHTWSPAPAVTA